MYPYTELKVFLSLSQVNKSLIENHFDNILEFNHMYLVACM